MGKNWLECDILGRESFQSGKCLLNINTVKSCIIKILLIDSRGFLFRSWRTCKAIQFLEWNLGLRSEINPGKPFYTCTFLESLWMSIIAHLSHHEVLPASCFSCTGNPPREPHILSPLPLPLPALGSWSLHSARSGMVQTKMNQGCWAGERRRLDCTCQGWAWKTRAAWEGWPGGTGPSIVGTWSCQGAKQIGPAWLLPRTTPLPSMGLLGL